MKTIFQFHLSTLVVIMLLAGGLVWLNIREISNPAHQEFLTLKKYDPMLMPARCFRGWPWYYEWNCEENPRAELPAVIKRDWKFIALNSFFGISVLVVAAVVLERWCPIPKSRPGDPKVSDGQDSTGE